MIAPIVVGLQYVAGSGEGYCIGIKLRIQCSSSITGIRSILTPLLLILRTHLFRRRCTWPALHMAGAALCGSVKAISCTRMSTATIAELYRIYSIRTAQPL